ncbi:hypothetical protein KP78_33650 [Jeotgalibacillus soli]|uniref:DUF92 domain-containing protein n=2 Tax=Jeotgalibacillus soli TaxID=889306 RepID=A0A0C2VIT3_9BACL|nr:hypothetical protein KP78_33650 [Jeotgalibacillus soli]
MISTTGWRTGLLTLSGAIASVIVANVMYWSLGWEGLIVLASFFVSSSVWSKWKMEEKMNVEEKSAKTSHRDWQQVTANGGPASLFSMLYAINGAEVWLLAFLAALAAANADTWASEIGVLSRWRPLSIRTFKVVESGTSGAISVLGTLATIVGALFIALIGTVIFFEWDFSILVVITLLGIIGSFLDTFLGAFVQVEFRCTICGINTESKYHHHLQTVHEKGILFINNEVVNAASGVVAGAMTLFFYV